MADITCPQCGNNTELLTVRRASEEFCTHCDFPLFWAQSAVPIATPGANSDSTLRRLPGAGGRQRIGSKICPDCGELNPMSETHCARCSTELEPRPAAPAPLVVPPPPPAPVVEPEPIATPWWWWWRWPLAVGLGLVVLIPILIEL